MEQKHGRHLALPSLHSDLPGPLARPCAADFQLTWLMPRCLPAPQVDNRHQEEPVITPEQAAKLCDRNFGIGGDGVRRWRVTLGPRD